MTTAMPLDGATARTSRSSWEWDVTLCCVSVIAGVVVALTFIFGFGNVLDLGLGLGVPRLIAPLVAPLSTCRLSAC